MVQPVSDHRRHGARRAVRGGGDDLTAGGVLLVHGHGIGRHPIVDDMGRGHVHPAFGHQLVMDGLGTPAHLQPARQDAIRRQPAVHAVAHHLPDPHQPVVQFGARAEAQLVLLLHSGDGFAGGFGHRQHLFGCREGEGHAGAGIAAVFGIATLQLLLGHDEAATDRVIDLMEDHVPLRVGRRQGHAVRMPRQHGVVIEAQVGGGVELQNLQPGRGDLPGLMDLLQGAFGRVGVHGGGGETGQPQDGGAVGGMALASEGKAAMQAGTQAMCLEGLQPQRVQKARGRHHRPHRVRRRRADAHLQQIEDRQKHETPLHLSPHLSRTAPNPPCLDATFSRSGCDMRRLSRVARYMVKIIATC